MTLEVTAEPNGTHTRYLWLDPDNALLATLEDLLRDCLFDEDGIFLLTPDGQTTPVVITDVSNGNGLAFDVLAADTGIMIEQITFDPATDALAYNTVWVHGWETPPR